MKRLIFGILLAMVSLTMQGQVCFRVDYTETTYSRGPLYQYAHRYLNAGQVITEDATVFTLKNVYMVDERPEVLPAIPAGEPSVVIAPQAHLSEDAILAGSTMKMAECVAKQIYRLREARVNTLAGEVDHVPADGMAMQLVLNTLNDEEEKLTALFVGTTTTTEHTTYIVCDSLADGKNIFLRFSKTAGPVDKDDLSGEPVRVNLMVEREKVAVNEENRKKNTPPTYILVDKAKTYTVIYNHKTIYEKTIRP